MKAGLLFYLLLATFLHAWAQFFWTPTVRQNGPTTPKFSWNGDNKIDGDSNSRELCKLSQSSCDCCRMVQEVRNLEEFFEETLMKLEEEHNNIHQTLEHFHDKRVAFSACLDESRVMAQSTDSSVIIKYKNVILNLGNAYEDTTGIFTVPFAGVYSLTVTVYSDSGSKVNKLNSCATLQVNNTEVASTRDRNLFDQEDSGTIAVALKLKAGDEVFVKLHNGCTLYDGSRYNAFSGFLLYSNE